jgi:SAM-dependent methyltransferase
MSNPISRPCPVCGEYQRRLVYRQRFLDGPLSNGYDVVVCSKCGAGFADGIVSQAEMDRYYAEQSKYAYDYAGGTESPWDFKRFEATVAQIAPHLKSQDVRILDIGCATGGLLSVFKRRGYQNVMGADPSPACAMAAERLHGVKVRTATLSQLGNWKERFDLVLMLGVLEHLRETTEAVQFASRLLDPGGLVYCAVPDVERFADCPNAPYQQFSLEHVSFFSIRSLERLMANCGMAAVDSWRWTVEWREGVMEPIASGLYDLRQPSAATFDECTGPSLERYLAFSKEGDRRILATIDSLRCGQDPILVWGAGTLTRRLLATTRFAEANITAFVDSNPHLHGGQLANRPILSPEQIAGRKERVLICSVAFEKEIALAISDQHGAPNRIISLLGTDFP